MAGTRTGVSFSQALGGRDQDRCQFQPGVGWQGPGQVSVSDRCWVAETHTASFRCRTRRPSSYLAETRTGVSFRQVLGTDSEDQDGCTYQTGIRWQGLGYVLVAGRCSKSVQDRW